MKTKASRPKINLPKEKINPFILAFFDFSHLKRLYRQGWLKRGIPERCCESVAEHSFGVAVVAMLLVDSHFPKLDALKVLRMALIHDFGEIYAGDITPDAGFTTEQKQHLERESLNRVLKNLPQRDAYLNLWEEFEAGATPEARFVRQIDKLEMALQASVYEHQGLGDLSEFHQSAGVALSDPHLDNILQELEALK